MDMSSKRNIDFYLIYRSRLLFIRYPFLNLNTRIYLSFILLFISFPILLKSSCYEDKVIWVVSTRIVGPQFAIYIHITSDILRFFEEGD